MVDSRLKALRREMFENVLSLLQKKYDSTYLKLYFRANLV